jgi:hypothetical protein
VLCCVHSTMQQLRLQVTHKSPYRRRVGMKIALRGDVSLLSSFQRSEYFVCIRCRLVAACGCQNADHCILGPKLQNQNKSLAVRGRAMLAHNGNLPADRRASSSSSNPCQSAYDRAVDHVRAGRDEESLACFIECLEQFQNDEHFGHLPECLHHVSFMAL